MDSIIAALPVIVNSPFFICGMVIVATFALYPIAMDIIDRLLS